jgi:Ca-activated chloride channel family protein
LLLTGFSLSAVAQSDRSHIRSGNRDMRGGAEGGAAKAEVKYRKALTANASNPQALYNLGCALMAQNKDSLAMEMFERSVKLEKSKQRKAMAYHNMGVIMQKQQQYGPAMQQYMQALRLAPHSNDTRYNYVLCQRLKKDENNNNGGGGNNNDKDNKQDKDQNKDKDKDKNQDQKQNKDKDKEQQQQPQQQMSKDNAEQLLNAAMQEEKSTRQRMRKAMSQPSRRNLQKNW